ncbi:TPA: flagellar hook-associated protein 3 [Candidatus Gastranaerophilales bacterium HUM_13]|jgi:flagellar hook-associated protein 3 FlgL|nr:putative flagellar hook-associated protein [Acinetobacter sp. CAG:196]DAA86508.1 MAG TPA: flagellar hook-associated protein 3 [Candidatus Gastranaerophilales bacterium HUM_4]DAA92822.1 MAG TPA: flagellar hook-associated protein 3 [Candidatus Gastranaerophilales bacterium HUM_5]DAA94827.1 MAG TPA: flagellar hook-associated protein 3 [Candidatus Gastranaerophilales bacterium HUM_8]DAA99752.1 MAG TPA: flagellar hook-associated protein 3 [Candidatus Gastranaerophilales bacterium HUM_11]DAB08452
MVNRISTSGRYSQLIADMQKQLSNYNKLTQQLASGSKVNNITDNPIAAVNILNTNRQLGQIDIFSKNVEMAMTELSTLDDLMDLATGYLSTAWDKAVQANNQTYGKSSLEALKVEIDEITKTMVDLANTEYNDNYIFGGTNTKILPYEQAENGDIIYNGTPYDNKDYIRQTEVADGVFEVINTTGDKVFGYYKSAVEPGNGVYTDANGKRVIESTDAGTGQKVYKYENGVEYTGDVADLTDGAEEEAVGVMGALRKLSNSLGTVVEGLEAGDDAMVQEGYAEMNSTLDMFSDSLNTITTEQTKFGGVYNRMEMSTSTLETNGDNLTAYLSQIKDIDITTAITEWMQAQYAYQASLQVTSASMGMSLLNYM